MADFSKKQGKVQGVEPGSRAPHEQGGEPTSGIVQAPQTPQNRGGAGEGIPANTRKIK